MLGYITPDKPELKVKEYELYSAYYCGICKAIKRRHGELPRMVLSYDSVLLAMVLSSLGDHWPPARLERCLVHPVKKKNILYDDPAIDYAADMLVILASYKFRDDWKDERKALGGLGSLAFSHLHKKITGMHPETCAIIEESMQELARLEKENCQSMDEAAEPFAQLMQAVFAGYPGIRSEDQREALRELGYFLGKWIYLIDAVDDLPEDLEKGRYNPLKTLRDDPDFQRRLEFSLIAALERASLAYGKLEAAKNKAIIENILYSGLLKRTEQILGIQPAESQESREEDRGHQEKKSS